MAGARSRFWCRPRNATYALYPERSARSTSGKRTARTDAQDQSARPSKRSVIKGSRRPLRAARQTPLTRRAVTRSRRARQDERRLRKPGVGERNGASTPTVRGCPAMRELEAHRPVGARKRFCQLDGVRDERGLELEGGPEQGTVDEPARGERRIRHRDRVGDAVAQAQAGAPGPPADGRARRARSRADVAPEAITVICGRLERDRVREDAGPPRRSRGPRRDLSGRRSTRGTRRSGAAPGIERSRLAACAP